jgi:hypothetical protein
MAAPTNAAKREKKLLPTRSRPHMAHSISYCGAVPCPELGINRKSWADRQNDAIDPERTLALARKRPAML